MLYQVLGDGGDFGDTATWTGAGVSFLAVCAALWLARRSDRREDAEQSARGLVLAEMLRPEVRRLKKSLEVLRGHLQSEVLAASAELNGQWDVYTNAAAQLDVQTIERHVDRLHLLPSSSGALLARTIVPVGRIRMDIHRALSAHGDRNVHFDEIVLEINEALSILGQAELVFGQAINQDTSPVLAPDLVTPGSSVQELISFWVVAVALVAFGMNTRTVAIQVGSPPVWNLVGLFSILIGLGLMLHAGFAYVRPWAERVSSPFLRQRFKAALAIAATCFIGAMALSMAAYWQENLAYLDWCKFGTNMSTAKCDVAREWYAQ